MFGTRLKFGGAFSGAVVAVVVGVGGPAAASGAGASALGLKGFSAVVADSAHQHVFVSGVGSDPVVVAGFDGAVVGSLAALDGATSLALSADEGILYAAIGGTDEIAAVNTSTLQEVAVYFTGAGHDPRHLAVVGKNIWFSYGASGSGAVGVGVVDPAALTVGTTSESAFYGAPVLAASPTAPNRLVAGDGGMSPSVIESFDVSTGAPVLVARSNPWTQPDGCSNLGQLAVTASGTDVVAACGAPYHGSQLTLSAMTEDAVYQTGPYPTSVAIAAGDGAIAIGAGTTSGVVDVFAPGGTNPTGSYPVGAYGGGVAGVAWNQPGTKLFAVTTGPSPVTAPALTVINLP